MGLNKLYSLVQFIIVLIIILAFCPIATYANCLRYHEDHEPSTHDHHNHPYELGFSAGLVQMEPEDETALVMHLHFIRSFPNNSWRRYFGLGVGFEVIFGNHMHYNVMVTIAIYPMKNLVLTISPGVLIAKHHNEYETSYSTHLEAIYGFDFNGFEVGPVVGFAKAGDDKHYMIGIHLGKLF